jgi:hypothetical protein
MQVWAEKNSGLHCLENRGESLQFRNVYFESGPETVALRISAALRYIRARAAVERVDSHFFLAVSDCQAHGVAIDMSGVAG